MITKFICKSDVFKSIEFEKIGEGVTITIEDSEVNELQEVDLSEKDLFSLIGQLLRIQSEIRKEVDNV